MHEGQKLEEVVRLLDSLVRARQDYVAPQGAVNFTAENDGSIVVDGLPREKLSAPPVLNDWAHRQVQQHFEIPAAYYDRMKTDAPDLLATNLNRWRSDDPLRKRMLRVIGEVEPMRAPSAGGDQVRPYVRAFVSDTYRPLENFDMALTAIPLLRDAGAVVRSQSVTDSRLYLKSVVPSLERTVRGLNRGDVIRGGVVISNSDVGGGAISLAFFVEILACTNGLITEQQFRKTHLGKRIDVGEAAAEWISDNTRKLDDAAFWSGFKDVLGGMLTAENMDRLTAKFEGAAQDLIPKEAHLEGVVEVTTKRLGIPDGMREGILRNLIDGGDLSRWGLMNAVTAVANTVQDYTAATELERAGGKIIEMAPADWRVIAKAA